MFNTKAMHLGSCTHVKVCSSNISCINGGVCGCHSSRTTSREGGGGEAETATTAADVAAAAAAAAALSAAAALALKFHCK